MRRTQRLRPSAKLLAAAALAAGICIVSAPALAQPPDGAVLDAVTWTLRIVFAVLVAVVVPVYIVKYGPSNFLWFSDIGLLGICAALWLDHRLLGSMMAVAVLLPETVWLASFLSGAVTKGRGITTLAGYMFDARIPLYLRLISGAFHLALPPGALWLVYRSGYDERAFVAQTVLAWIVLPATLFLTPPGKNVNWVRGFGHPPRSPWPLPVHFALVMLAYPLAVYLPTHWLLAWLFGD
jgi:hypothetical protein